MGIQLMDDLVSSTLGEHSYLLSHWIQHYSVYLNSALNKCIADFVDAIKNVKDGMEKRLECSLITKGWASPSSYLSSPIDLFHWFNSLSVDAPIPCWTL